MVQDREILRFSVGNRLLGVWMRQVEEILKLPQEQVTRLSSAPKQLLGLVNLRGEVVPVLDTYQLMLGTPWESGEDKNVTVLIYMYEDHPTGMVVEDLEDVVDSNLGELEPISNAGGLFSHTFYTKQYTLELLQMELLFAKGLEVLHTSKRSSEDDEVECFN